MNLQDLRAMYAHRARKVKAKRNDKPKAVAVATEKTLVKEVPQVAEAKNIQDTVKETIVPKKAKKVFKLKKRGVSNPIDAIGNFEEVKVDAIKKKPFIQEIVIKEEVVKPQVYTKSKPIVKVSPTPKCDNGKVLLCAIGKMENLYIREWVEHYQSIGFDNIVLFDNNDIDGEHFEEVIGDYIDSGFVILKNARGFFQYQIEAYNKCFSEYRDKYSWISFFDIDEFLSLDKQFNNVKEFLALSCFEKFNCVRVCWENYDDNGLIKVENKNYSVKRFTHPRKGDNQTKAFIRTTVKALKSTSPHIVSKQTSFAACNSEGVKCVCDISIGTKVSLKNAKLKHYRFKTIEEFVLGKMVRLWPTHYKNGGKDALNLSFFFRFNDKTNEKEAYGKALIKKYKINANTTSSAKQITEPTFSQDKVCLVNSWVHVKSGQITHFNWGDELNFLFLPQLMDDITFKVYNKTEIKKTNYQFIGSVISNVFTNSNTVIWGSGAPTETTRLKYKPKKVCAVRGPLTRKILLKSGVQCPEVYGDPALLLPYYYHPIVEKKYKYGIIPHHTNVDKSVLNNIKNNKDVKIIKLKGYDDWKTIIDEMLSCEYIISESLHGLIVAEAYNIPNVWIKINFDKQPMKYHDFFLSLGKDREKPYTFTSQTKIKDLEQWCKSYEHVNNLDLNKLIEACPFKLNISSACTENSDIVEDFEEENYTEEVMETKEETDVKLFGMTITYNESRIIPYVMPYYENLGMDKLIVYDNESTDNTVELLKQYPFVEVRTFKTNHTLNDRVNSELKSNIFKEFKGDGIRWITISDFDEVIYYNGEKSFKKFLREKTNDGYNNYNKEMLEPLCYNFPPTSGYAHTYAENFHPWGRNGEKMTLFNLNDTKELKYLAGAHRASYFTVSGGKKSLNNCKELQSFHLKYLDYEYNRQKYKIYAERRSELNKKMHWGIEYDRLKKDEAWENEWQRLNKESKKI